MNPNDDNTHILTAAERRERDERLAMLRTDPRIAWRNAQGQEIEPPPMEAEHEAFLVLAGFTKVNAKVSA